MSLTLGYYSNQSEQKEFASLKLNLAILQQVNPGSRKDNKHTSVHFSWSLFVADLF